MDFATIIGFVLAYGLMYYSIAIGTAPFSVFIDIPSILIVIGGGFAVMFVCFPLKHCLLFPMVCLKTLLNKPPNYGALIEQLVSLAETARRDGLLALEGRIEQISDRFIKIGIQMAVDGTRPEVIEDVLKTEMAAASSRHKDAKNLLDQVGKYAPAFGMIGTLLGLVMMLSNMSDPSSIGAGMAVALLTTLYGAVMSNAGFLPMAEKLAYLNKMELLGLEMVVRGVLAIQSGENPRVIEQKLNAFLPQKMRRSSKGAA